eukprot:3069919-Pyramimonas_sp.AAC.1
MLARPAANRVRSAPAQGARSPPLGAGAQCRAIVPSRIARALRLSNHQGHPGASTPNGWGRARTLFEDRQLAEAGPCAGQDAAKRGAN